LGKDGKMSFEIFLKDKNSKYGDGVLLEEFKENYSLYAAQESKDGPVYKRWCRMRTGKDKYTDKDIPVQIRLGNQTEAIEKLKYFLEQLNAPVEGEDIPF
jgi:hypothetical protein